MGEMPWDSGVLFLIILSIHIYHTYGCITAPRLYSEHPSIITRVYSTDQGHV